MKYLINLGGMKCATNSLYHLLAQHPEIEPSYPKELNFFVEASNSSYQEYESCFNIKAQTRCLFEASTQYMKYPISPDASENMDIIRSNVQFTALLRDPLERLESHIYHVLARNKKITQIDNVISAAFECSRYYQQLSPYFDKFGQKQLMTFFFEDFVNTQSETANAIVKFLGLDAHKFHTVGVKNARSEEEQTLTLDILESLGPTRISELVNDVECLEVVLGKSTRQAWKHFWQRIESL